MRAIVGLGLLLLLVAGIAPEPSTDPPLDNTRLTVHTLVREDIFAGWMEDDMQRYARGEKNVDLLLEKRPRSRAELLAWKGGTELFRAVLAHEAGNDAEFNRLFLLATEHLSEARKLAPKNPGVAAVVGGSYVVFADRLPEVHRAGAWSACYDNYLVLWQMQGRLVEKLPLHLRGELLAGMIQATQRTGRTDELATFLDKTIEVLPDTEYGRVAQEWKANPEAAVGANISCKYCHDSGRLTERLAAIAEKSK